MRSLSASICLPSLGQGAAAAYRLGTVPSDDRAGDWGLPVAQRVEQCLRRGPIEILVEIVIDLQDRRVDAGTQTLDLDQCEHAVRRSAAHADTELLLTGANHLVRTAQPAGRCCAGLQ